MLKLTSLALGLLTVISLAPSAQAIPIDVSILAIQRPQGDLQSQVILNVNPQVRQESAHRYGGDGGKYYRQESERHRQLELAREREEQARLAAKRLRRQQQYARYHGNFRDGYRGYQGNSYIESRGNYGEYRRDR
jgi:hypothetical protein